jgi:two-component system, chemotaxis family, protein-glutamate methylesterase/glutaminase
MPGAAPTRVLVADDSGLMRRVLSASLTSSGFDVVAEASDGDEALAQWERHRPDVMTLDLAMPGRDGIGVLRALRGNASRPVPVVVVSAFSPAHGARAVDALAEGAFDLVSKPQAGDQIARFAAELGEKLRAAATVPHGGPAAAAVPAPRAPLPRRRASTGAGRFVVIASSTGGPRALAHLIPALPSPLGAGGCIVQHMPAGFTGSLAARLDRASALRVAEAAGGEALDPGTLLVAPGGSHLRFGLDGRTLLSDDAPVGALRPRADLAIEDLAARHGERVLLVVLTGMGRDGELGARAVKAAGGRVLVEAEQTCTVYGMPRAVAESGLADAILPLGDLPAAITREAWC